MFLCFSQHFCLIFLIFFFFLLFCFRMATRKFTVKGKIMKETPNPLETSVAQALYDLQVNQQMKDLGDELKDLFILSAIEVKVAGGRAAVVVFIPYILRVQFRKIQVKFCSLVRILCNIWFCRDAWFASSRRSSERRLCLLPSAAF